MKRITSAVALIAASLLGLTACGSSDDPLASSSPTGASASGAAGAPIVVGGANFSESTLLAEIYAGALKAKGIDATTKPNIGSREIYLRALEDNSVQVFPEYTGALAFNYDKAYTGTDPDEVYQHVQQVLPKTLTGLEKTYGVKFGSFRPLTGQGIVQALKNGQADAANIFSTDPAIAANGFVQLEDTEKLFGSQNIVPLVRADRADEVKEALNAVSAKLTTEVVAGMLKKTDIDKQDPKAVAQEFLTANGLG